MSSEENQAGISLYQRPDGTFEMYDPTWDITIHCTSEEDQKKTMAILKEAFEKVGKKLK